MASLTNLILSIPSHVLYSNKRRKTHPLSMPNGIPSLTFALVSGNLKCGLPRSPHGRLGYLHVQMPCVQTVFPFSLGNIYPKPTLSLLPIQIPLQMKLINIRCRLNPIKLAINVCHNSVTAANINNNWRVYSYNNNVQRDHCDNLLHTKVNNV